MGAAEHVVVVGGGIGGLATALAFGQAGHRVTLVERDRLPVAADVETAFLAERRGAPQVHQTHGFLARLVVTLRDRFPDVLADLLAAGCTTLPPAADLGEPRPGDEDLAVLVVRRTTFEWVLRRAVLARPGV
ncbi:MAG TPA: FAD-dependent oxidoreductase, partial [Acidimicrobiales bacterium]